MVRSTITGAGIVALLAVLLLFCGDCPTNPGSGVPFAVSPDTLALSETVTSQQVTVATNNSLLAWSALADVNWISATPASGTGSMTRIGDRFTPTASLHTSIAQVCVGIRLSTPQQSSSRQATARGPGGNRHAPS